MNGLALLFYRITMPVCLSAAAAKRIVLSQSTRLLTSRCISTAQQSSKACPTLSQMQLPSDTWSNRLLSAALSQVPEHGWTKEAIVAAGMSENKQKSVSLSSATVVADPTELVEFWMNVSTANLKRELAASNDNMKVKKNTTASTSTLEKLAHAIQTRLEYNQDFCRSNTWHAAMAMGAQPSQAAVTRQQLEDLMDVIVEHCIQDDDSSIVEEEEEVSIASRIGLGAVYVATELHMLSDESIDYADTWVFLRQRLNEWDMLRSSTTSGAAGGIRLPNVEVATVMGLSLASGAASVILGGAAKAPSLLSFPGTNNNGKSILEQDPAALLWKGVAAMGDMAAAANSSATSTTGNRTEDSTGGVVPGSDPRHFDVPKAAAPKP